MEWFCFIIGFIFGRFGRFIFGLAIVLLLIGLISSVLSP